jgi:hypothetical protein
MDRELGLEPRDRIRRREHLAFIFTFSVTFEICRDDQICRQGEMPEMWTRAGFPDQEWHVVWVGRRAGAEPPAQRSARPAPDALRSKQAETSQAAAADEPRALLRPCRCCGGRMIIIEIFAGGCRPKHRPAPATAAVSIDTS